MKHRHEWKELMPTMQSLPEDVAISLCVETLRSTIFGVLVCSCGKTAHMIKSNRGGIKVHDSDYYLNEAKRLAEKYKFDLPILTNVPPDKKQ